ncbi:MAG: bifunctional diaminohydroxyphosphoribosylaminopyrimidine deaminase/5-amino-6-(5-phosphoribosylamino)uracil reductase RibD [Eubacterium sp.]|nr:bifunctional diaminohydroxyphosphoribosylaminopyrimidine deaminase/5-amino-6-(5-phosphoribosylamino)uracil reductase RibD [Eubacterium sp.]
MDKEKYMQLAIELAKRGEGLTSPNPLVGCVIVRENADGSAGIIARGWHEYCGGYHAERNAILSCEEDLKGTTMFVTLEPCCHHGKTPPCTDLIIERGIKRVYVGSDDPNPKVAGKGIRQLEAAGIEVIPHFMKDECDELNDIFFKYITSKMPYTAMKYAMTLDGKISTCTGDSKWITGDEARKHVHGLRKKYSAILVGVGTVIADDPGLDYRGEDVPSVSLLTGGEQPVLSYDPTRVIMDTHLRIPIDSKIVKTAADIPTIIAYGSDLEPNNNRDQNDNESMGFYQKKQKLIESGIKLLPLSVDENGHVSVTDLLKKLGGLGLDSVLIEGGSHIHGAFFEHRELIDRVYAYIAPKLSGGEAAKGPVGGAGVERLSDALRLTDVEVMTLGEDILISGKSLKTLEKTGCDVRGYSCE